MNDSSEQSKTIEKEIEEGKKRDDILCSFKGIGLAQALLGGATFFFGLLIVLVSQFFWRGPIIISKLGDGMWCSLLSIPAGILCFATGANCTYCLVCWSSSFSILSSVLMFVHLFIQFIAVVEMATFDVWGMLCFHILLIVLASAQFALSIYNSTVFTRILINYHRNRVGGSDVFCPCWCCCDSSYRQPVNFAYVVYSNINPKKYDA